MYDNSKILITGGTGSFGSAFCKWILKNHNPKKIIIFSRDEIKQWEMQNKLKDDRIRFFIGDVRDKDRLYRALDNVDYVVHAAALKIVPTAEYNPFECIKTNIQGSMNLIDAAIDRNVKKVVALSTDKASSPVNLYGASKLASDKLFVSANVYSGIHDTKFSIVRYGNVMGSRGSIIPYLLSLNENDVVTLTDERMTRFMITIQDAINLVDLSFRDMLGGEIYVKKIPSIKIIDLIKYIIPKAKIKKIGIRPGEKLHEQMISDIDSISTYSYESYFKIIAQNLSNKDKIIKNGKLVSEGFVYSSEQNDNWLSKEKLLSWLKKMKEN